MVVARSACFGVVAALVAAGTSLAHLVVLRIIHRVEMVPAGMLLAHLVVLKITHQAGMMVEEYNRQILLR